MRTQTHIEGEPWAKGLGAGGEGDDRGWDGWMASLTRWMWVSVNSGSWWWTGRPGMLRFMGSQRVGHDWAIELNWTEGTNSQNLTWRVFNSLIKCINAFDLTKSKNSQYILNTKLSSFHFNVFSWQLPSSFFWCSGEWPESQPKYQCFNHFFFNF